MRSADMSQFQNNKFRGFYVIDVIYIYVIYIYVIYIYIYIIICKCSVSHAI